ncbi:hypothetical protein O5O45_02745 [Hahella aquimaris]|nr:hypothetical protein [Hahella sp. HNIBRBA332]WLQ14855.1 hypothetical protein O5O45_02745 [Hahella sp. HNIBRBA332]
MMALRLSRNSCQGVDQSAGWAQHSTPERAQRCQAFKQEMEPSKGEGL